MRKIANTFIGHQPSMTVEKAVEIISKQLGYKAGMKQGNRFHFVEKSSMIAAIIKMDQYEDRTRISVMGTFPKAWLDFVCLTSCIFTGVGFFVWVAYAIIHLAFEKEIIDFVKNCPDFYPDNKPE